MKLREYFLLLIYSLIWRSVACNQITSRSWSLWGRIGCKALSSLVELIESKMQLEKELYKFEDSFEWDELKKKFNLALFDLSKLNFKMRSYIFVQDIKYV